MKNENLPSIVCGTENELAIRAWDMRGRLLTNGELYQLTTEALPDELALVEDFMVNGGRYYYDHIYDHDTNNDSGHLEISTPECSSFEEAVVYDLTGEEIILSALDNLVAGREISNYDFHKRVTDENGQFWGVHENYLTTLDLDPFSGSFYKIWASHLATRSIFTGAGRVSRKGFNVSQKTRSLNMEFSFSAHSDRPLVDLKHASSPLTPDDEEAGRIQVSCGDANVSPWALRMRLGTTALIIRMQEQGVYLDDLALEDPLASSLAVCYDPSLSTPLRLANKRTMTALDIQHAFALRAVHMSEKTKLPPEEVVLAQEWLEACKILRTDSDLLLGKVDWITKRYCVSKLPILSKAKNLAQRRHREFEYDRIADKPGIGVKMMQKGTIDPWLSEDQITRAMYEPPQETRAVLRGSIVRTIDQKPYLLQRIHDIGWDSITVDGTTIELKTRDTSNPILQKIIDRATS